MAVWKLLLDNMETITFYVSAVVAALGLLAFVLVWLFWRLIARIYWEFLAKLGVAFFRFVAAASAVASKSVAVPAGTPLAEQPWVVTILMAVIGYLLWEFAGAIGDHKHKLARDNAKAESEQEIEVLTQDRDDAERQSFWLRRVMSHLRTLANEKLQRVKRAVQQSTASRGSLPETRTALAPSEQIGEILEALASFWRVEVVSTGRNYDQNFRVGLYAEQGGYLAPIGAFDLKTRSHNPFTSYPAHRDRFRLDNTANPAHAVRCVVEGRMLVVPDCANHPTFQFFHNQQRNYLRSMVAFPLPGFSPKGGAPVRAALLIDTDVAGYFQEKDAESIKIYLEEFAVRLALEYAIRGLMS
jgi:hypothetical protein